MIASAPDSLEEFLDLCHSNQELAVGLEYALVSGWDEEEARRFFARRLATVKPVRLEYLLPYLERYHIRWNEVMDMVCLALQRIGQIHPSYSWREHVLRRPAGPVVPLNLYGPW